MNFPFFSRRIVRVALVGFLILTIAVIPAIGGLAKKKEKLSPGCRDLFASVQSVAIASAGSILFTCGGSPALSVGKATKATPTFHLPNGYATLTLVAHVPGAASCSPGQQLISGRSFSFSFRGTFDYCSSFSNVPNSGLASFDVDWRIGGGRGDDKEDDEDDDHDRDDRECKAEKDD